MRRLVFVLLALPALGAATTDRTVDRWGVEEGLPNNALTDIIQTRDGYLWVASWARIVRFDGVRFTPIATDLPNVHARALVEHPDGSVWIGASGEGLVRWRPEGVRTFTRANGLSGSDVRALAIDDAGRIWAATENGVSIVDTATVATLRVGDGLPDASVSSVSRGRDGWMSIVTVRGVCRARAGELRCLPRRPGTGPPTAVLEDANGRVWIGTAGTGLIRGDEVPGGACQKGCLAGLDVTTLVEARNGGLWVGLGKSGGVALLRDDRLTQYRAEQGLPSFPVRAIYEDTEGSTWIAVDTAGLVRLRTKRVTAYTTAEGLPAPAVASMSQDSQGTIWAATRCGPVGRFRGDRFEAAFQEHTRDACTTSVLATRDGSLWIGTQSRGLFRWDGRRMHHLGVEDGLSNSEINVLFEDRDGVLWIGSRQGGIHRFADGRLSRAFGPDEGVATGYISSFAQDPSGRIWIGSNANGLSTYEHGRFTALGAHEGLPTGNISALVVDTRGDLWIGTAAHGLFRRRGDTYNHFGVEQGLGDNLVALIVEDGDGNLWVSTARGIVRLTRDRIEAVAAGRSPSLEPLVLDRRDGLPHNEGSGGGNDPSGLLARDGRLWFPTIDGVGVVDPRALRINDRAPPLAIEQVLLSGAPAPVSGAIVHVPAGTPTIEVRYTAFSFLDPSKVRFRYRLVGFGAAWEDVGARRAAYFTRLPPASYTFEVIAANDDGVWNTTPATLRLIVAPFWWERAGVRAGGLVVLLIVTAFAVRSVSVRRTRARVAELERAHALQRERERIARDLHDELGSRLTRIALLADQRHRGDDTSRVAAAARDAVRTMGELVWSVNARHDTLESFATYASEFAQEQTDAAGLQCRFDIPPDLGALRLRAETRRHLYLAFKEAVNNAVKHGQASRIDVKMAVEGRDFMLEVADDGHGLPASPEGIRLDGSSGNGFDNMRGRMRAVGGALSVDSAAGRGTRLTFRLPVS